MPRSEIPKRTEPKEEISTDPARELKVFAQRDRRIQNAADAAADARKHSSEESHKRDFAKAKAGLANMTYAQVVQFLTDMPVGVMELYLLAEEDTLNRPMVLGRFPKPSTTARRRWLPESLVTVSA